MKRVLVTAALTAIIVGIFAAMAHPGSPWAAVYIIVLLIAFLFAAIWPDVS